MAGLELCLANLAINFRNIEDEAKKKAKEWADSTMQDSQNVYCPVDTGALKASGNVTESSNILTGYVIKLAYNSDGSAPYAVYVHQIPIPHKHGQWQFLLTPFNKRQPKLIELLNSVKV